MDLTRRHVLVGAGATGVAALGAAVLVTRDRPRVPSPAQRTSFGSVALLGWSRRTLTGAAGHDGHVHDGSVIPAGAAGHAGHAGHVPVPSAVHGAWTDAMTVDVSVHNATKHPIELSAGQFRVRVAGGPMTVSLYATDRDAGPVAAGEMARLSIDYLVPPVGLGLGLEFADALSGHTLTVGRLDAGARS